MTDEEFLLEVKAEIDRARSKFPAADMTNAALVEEVGELSTALMYEPWNRVIAEAVQVAAMACRLATEGDWSAKRFRDHKVHAIDKYGKPMRYVGPEFEMPEPLSV